MDSHSSAWTGPNTTHFRYSDEQSCHNSLTNLALLYESRFDFAVMDGNHEAEYLRSEVDVVRRLLIPNGVLLLDDVSEAWADIKAEYANLASAGWKPLGADGRVGVLQKNIAANPPRMEK
jgi:hypothetical protein